MSQLASQSVSKLRFVPGDKHNTQVEGDEHRMYVCSSPPTHKMFVPGDKQHVCCEGGDEQLMCDCGGGRTQYMGDKRLCYVGKCFSSAVGSLSSSVVSVLVTVHHCGTGLALL